ncbi:2-oxoglutarate dehydrogenase complex dihydrolipoyllysine-residue succinyltransferase [Chryseobacterium sp. WG14]|jgi:2-oxoglutarate dehydrogenase E2 component (dihydrolipoamide succinyltransferase)|uniref:Dihydrolipoyllysine-residue succinyltransferase component of 2-oxoglutarate dehydrogenase complex n=1 Tax=Chryseobacterium rhizosphaerae TaxID=395937 RepID=A0AAE3Y6D2_9FLAO|nr:MULTISPECIES: 2-oxoglutarate dehydrogenase complex dihydrolipoyllysine-residue succinyltransferase [Chryseobacterium]MBL3546753.1 2-oxoglutarate dehydrogenase complex dihydrolipoyllysine-residue succinyltransferase [Chryseobacterium sp. KMC2]MCQ9633766.1 2-oxoglutarate dehydrogenase complex dihydrolipoyllysine-residue succinyltransferase [Chryseobacterium sp. WG23]MCQ9639043.1 2-oxoglutarate dehydrogenase complex dihydrolipoyllysine-residue succinyltransferase [Chryseobacterium sp. WG14]MDC8
MSVLEMKVPSPGESITEVEIATWLVKDGDYVEKDQPIAEVDSDKATLELPAEQSGIITLKAEEGDVVQVGQVVCLIDMDAARPEGNAPAAEAPKQEEAPKAAEPAKQEAPKPAAPVAAPQTYATGAPSPAAKKILDEKGINAGQVSGSGRDGRITKTDAELAAVPALGGSPLTATGARSTTTTKLSVLRRKIAQRLVSVKNETAMLTTFNEVDMSEIFRLRKQYKEEFAQKHGVGLGFMSFFTKAVTRALEMYPDVNASIDGDFKINYDFCDISIAVSGPKGLMVPVLRNAENMTFSGVEANIKDLATKVRDGKITVDEMTGGTFTITNGGTFGSMLSTPIINPPQSAILGMHNIIQRPVAVDGQVVIRPMMYVAMSYDHRIIDGKESVGFLVAVKEGIDNPVAVLMGGDERKGLGL